MSGEKRARIAFGNWYRERVREPVIRALDAAGQAAIRAGVTSLRDAESAELRRRQDATERIVRGMSERGRAAEASIAARLAEHASRLDEVQASSGLLRDEVRQIVRESEHQVRSELAEERRQRQEEIQRLDASLTDVTEGRRRAREIAESLVMDSRAERALIEETLPHERFAPGRLDQLGRKVDEAEAYLGQGMPEAAVARGHDAYEALCALRVDVELRHQEWVRAQQKAVEALLRERGRVQANETSELHDESGEKAATITFDVDRWSNGALSGLHVEVSEELELVRAGTGTVDYFRQVIQETAPAFEQRLTGIVADARCEITASLRRAQVAALVTQALNDGFAYQMEHWAYADGDERRPIFARMISDSGNEIVVEVSPAEDDSGTGLRLMSFDCDTTAESLRERRMRAINDYLAGQHFDVGPIQARDVPDTTDVPVEFLPSGRIPGTPAVRGGTEPASPDPE